MKSIIAIVISALLFGACGGSPSTTEDENIYEGKAGQERYCKDQGWKYDAERNACRVE